MSPRVYCLLSVALGALLGVTTWNSFVSFDIQRGLCFHPFPYINPRLRCGPDDGTRKKEYETFEEELHAYLDRERTRGSITQAAVYFRDLEGGPWFGINEFEAYAPASLLKVPLMMTYLRLAQDTPDILHKRVTYSEAVPVESQLIPPAETLQSGRTYTVDDLLRRMIAYSDNRAMEALSYALDVIPSGNTLLARTFIELGIVDVPEDIDDFLSVKTYASLFRSLYNGGYLNREMSSKALGYLSGAQFTDGLVAGVPPGTVVAHKFGERVQDAEHLQLHDCGIVYYPENHYLLCIMTKGKDLGELTDVLRTISRMVFEEVRSRSES